MIPALLAALLLGQATSTKIVNPTNQSKAATTTTVGGKEGLDVNCIAGCSGGAGGGGGATNPDGGIDAPTQAKIWDGTDHLDITAAGAAKVDGSAVTQPISAAALPLPAGAATEASLSTLLTSGTFTARLGTLGQKTMAGSTPVVFASDQTALPVSGTFWQATQPISASSLPLPTGAATEATLGTLLLSSTFTARLGTLGQKAMSGSAPVVIASDQTAIPTSVASLPLPAGAATEATLLTRTKPADQQHAIVDSSALPTGAATETTLGNVKTKTDNLDVLLSTRTKPADQQHAIVDSSALPTGAATDGVLTGGTQKAITRGGAKGATAAADVTSTANGADHQGLDVAIQGNVPITAAALPLPSGAATETTLGLVKAKTDNIDVLLSTRTKPADQQHAIVDSSALPTGAATDGVLTGGTTKAIMRGGAKGATTAADVTSTSIDADHNAADVSVKGTAAISAVALPLPSGASTETTLGLVKAKTDNLDVLLSTRTKPADQQHAIVDSSALPTGAAISSAQTDRSQKTQITDGTRDGTVKAGSTAAAAADTGIVVALHPSSPLPAGTNALGSLTAGSQLIGKVGIDQTTPGTTNAVQANAGTNLNTSALALSATQTDGTQKSIARGGAKGATTAADTTSTAEGTDHQAHDVQLYHGGVAKDPTQIRALTSADTVTITDGSGPVTVDGTVTTNHGTPAQVASANAAGSCVSVSSSTTVLASFASRKAAFMAADATNTDDVYVSLSGTATSSSFRLSPGQAFNIDSPTAVYTGAIAGIAASGTQKICASEL